jgi:hypothetical protein
MQPQDFRVEQYLIELLDDDDAVIWEHRIACANDHDAIRRAGRIGHPYPMRLRRGSRIVARYRGGRLPRR